MDNVIYDWNQDDQGAVADWRVGLEFYVIWTQPQGANLFCSMATFRPWMQNLWLIWIARMLPCGGRRGVEHDHVTASRGQ